MNFRDLLRFTPALYESGATVYLEGPPGCGKSEFTSGVPRVLGPDVGFHRVDASVLDPAEIPGFVAPMKDKDNDAIATYLRSALMPAKDYLAAHPRGIYFVDELAATVPAVRHGLDAVLNERRFGPRALPPGWRVWAAGNRTKDFSGAQHLEAKTLNRVTRVQVEVNLDQWRDDFAIPQNLDPVGVAFLLVNPKVLASEVPANREPFCTLRSYTNMLRFWQALATPLRNSEATPVIAGYIGNGATAEFIPYMESAIELPTREEILGNPMKAKVPKKGDLAYAAQMCASRIAIDGHDIDACWRYILRLPAELHLPAAKQWSMIDSVRRRMTTSSSLVEYLSKNAKDIIEILQ